jgi:hypothetical protein
MKKCLIVILSLTWIQANAFEIIEKEVKSSSGLVCRTFLFLPKNPPKDIPVLVDAQGTGLYTISKGSVSVLGEQLLEKNKAIVLAVDKPGIKYDPDFKSSSTFNQFSVDINEFTKYTVLDLVSCYHEALRAHISKLGSGQISFIGHSEGSVILTKLYMKLLNDDELKIKDRIVKLVLTGTPFEPLGSIILSQINRKYQNGLKELINEETERSIRGDKDGFLIPFYSVSSGWIKEAEKTSSLEKDFSEMAKLNPNAQFIFFHGTEDQNTPILKIESFVEANKASKLPLKLELKKYQAGHYLNAQAIKDIGKLFQIEIKI